MWEDAKDKGADLAENAVDAVRARPLASTGVVAAVAMFLAREPLMELAGKLAGRKKKTGGKTKQKKPNRAKVSQVENDDDRSRPGHEPAPARDRSL
jgi:phage protein D